MKGVSEAEARLNELIAAFSLERAERWLRAQFASFDAADARAFDDASVSRSGRLVQFNFAKKLLKREIETFRGDGLPTQGHCSCMMNLV